MRHGWLKRSGGNLEIQPCEFPGQREDRRIVGFCRLDLVFEVADEMGLPVEAPSSDLVALGPVRAWTLASGAATCSWSTVRYPGFVA
jgi:hypothetical protein